MCVCVCAKHEVFKINISAVIDANVRIENKYDWHMKITWDIVHIVDVHIHST